MCEYLHYTIFQGSYPARICPIFFYGKLCLFSALPGGFYTMEKYFMPFTDWEFLCFIVLRDAFGGSCTPPNTSQGMPPPSFVQLFPVILNYSFKYIYIYIYIYLSYSCILYCQLCYMVAKHSLLN